MSSKEEEEGGAVSVWFEGWWIVVGGGPALVSIDSGIGLGGVGWVSGDDARERSDSRSMCVCRLVPEGG